jgi:hypothetical protein
MINNKYDTDEREKGIVEAWEERNGATDLNCVSYIDGSREEFPERRTYDDSNWAETRIQRDDTR